jgi:DNA-binding CsgD family transcriptional regulator/PAS domain-containing protein
MAFNPPTEEALLDLVGQIYDAAIEPAKWPLVLEHLAAVIGGTHAAIAVHSFSRPKFSLKVNWNVPVEFEKAMHEHNATNPFVPAAWHVGVGEPISAFRYVGEELKHSRWYKQTHEPHEHGDSAMVLLARSVSHFSNASVHRKISQPLFDDDELSVLRALAPHLSRAVMIADLLDTRALQRDMLAAALDRLAVAIILTDATGTIIHANQAANAHLDQGSAVRRTDRQVAASDMGAAVELAAAIGDAGGGTTIDIPRSGIVVSLKGKSGPDLAAWVLPLDSGLRRELAAGSAARVAVFIRELGDTAPFPAELFVRRYAITPAESRVMQLLVQGMAPAEAAEALGISLPTARTHLARLFDKTGTSRQADLVRLAMSALAPTASGG